MNRAVSAEESTISQDSDSPPKKKTGDIKKEAGRTKSLEPVAQDNYECSICLSWLKDPVLTTCGHRFCKNCLDEWRKKKNTKCPLDGMNLSIEDIFPDNYTKREIENMRKSFPDQFDPPNPIFECSFATVGCNFKNMDPQEVDKHLAESSKEHMDLLLSSYLKMQFQSWDPSEKNSNQEDNHQPSPTRELINKMYERIVILEQQNREQAMRIEHQEVKIERLLQIETRRNGTLVWKIHDFHKKVDLMKANPLQMFYSPECFTDPTGYKFCCRMALRRVNVLGFFVHFMKSENDYHLTWPFSGKMVIIMINKNPSNSTRGIVMSNPEIKAFHRPQEDVSLRGFGFLEYAEISDIIKSGFIDNDCLTIKIQVNIV